MPAHLLLYNLITNLPCEYLHSGANNGRYDGTQIITANNLAFAKYTGAGLEYQMTAAFTTDMPALAQPQFDESARWFGAEQEIRCRLAIHAHHRFTYTGIKLG
jgi:hypothetical protein